MRCTKCGYITFDHLQNCNNCSTDLQEVGSLLKGTAVNAEPFFFLQALLESEPETAMHPEGEEELLISAEDQVDDVTLSFGEQEAEETQEAVIDLEQEEIAEAGSEAGTEELEPPPALEAEEEKAETELPAAPSPEEKEAAAPAAGETEDELELSVEAAEEETPEGETRMQESEGQSLPEGLELKDISAPGENLTAGLEEIDLNDLMAEEEGDGEGQSLAGEELTLEDEINDEEVEKIFDLSDILSDEEADAEEAKAAAAEKTNEPAEEKKEEKNFADLDLSLELEDD